MQNALISRRKSPSAGHGLRVACIVHALAGCSTEGAVDVADPSSNANLETASAVRMVIAVGEPDALGHVRPYITTIFCPSPQCDLARGDLRSVVRSATAVSTTLAPPNHSVEGIRQLDGFALKTIFVPDGPGSQHDLLSPTHYAPGTVIEGAGGVRIKFTGRVIVGEIAPTAKSQTPLFRGNIDLKRFAEEVDGQVPNLVADIAGELLRNPPNREHHSVLGGGLRVVAADIPIATIDRLPNPPIYADSGRMLQSTPLADRSAKLTAFEGLVLRRWHELQHEDVRAAKLRRDVELRQSTYSASMIGAREAFARILIGSDYFGGVATPRPERLLTEGAKWDQGLELLVHRAHSRGVASKVDGQSGQLVGPQRILQPELVFVAQEADVLRPGATKPLRQLVHLQSLATNLGDMGQGSVFASGTNEVIHGFPKLSDGRIANLDQLVMHVYPRTFIEQSAEGGRHFPGVILQDLRVKKGKVKPPIFALFSKKPQPVFLY